MSLWGATVITNLMSAIPWLGQDIVEFIWGGFSVSAATLNRFFALHYLLPFVLAALVMMHLISLHDSAGSNNPLGISGNYDRIPFAPYFIFKDLITVFLFILAICMVIFYLPNILGDSENYVMANPMQTPPAIVPEWYLLPFYAILRSIPNKLFGVISMFFAILILLSLPFADLSRSRGTQFKPYNKIVFFIFAGNLLILMVLGAKHVESPFIEFGQIATVLYFIYYLLIVPFFNLIENAIIEAGITYKDLINYSSPVGFPRLFMLKLFLIEHPIIVYLFVTAVTVLPSTYQIIYDVLHCINGNETNYAGYAAHADNAENASQPTPLNTVNPTPRAHTAPWNRVPSPRIHLAPWHVGHPDNPVHSAPWNTANPTNPSNTAHAAPWHTANRANTAHVAPWNTANPTNPSNTAHAAPWHTANTTNPSNTAHAAPWHTANQANTTQAAPLRILNPTYFGSPPQDDPASPYVERTYPIFPISSPYEAGGNAAYYTHVANRGNNPYTDTPNVSYPRPLNTGDTNYADKQGTENRSSVHGQTISDRNWEGGHSGAELLGDSPVSNGSEFNRMLVDLDTVSATDAPSGDATDAPLDRSRSRSRSGSVASDYLGINAPIDADSSGVRRSPTRSPSPAPNYREWRDICKTDLYNPWTDTFIKDAVDFSDNIDPNTGLYEPRYTDRAEYVRSLRESEIDPATARAPMDVYNEFIFIANNHVFDDDTNPDLVKKLKSVRGFIHSQSNSVEGESLPSGSRSEIVKSLNKLYNKSIWNTEYGFGDRSPSSQHTSAVDWSLKHCTDAGLNRGINPGPPFKYGLQRF